MDILTPEDGTTTLSQNIGHQSFNPKPQLHHCKSMKAPTVTHLLQQRGIEKVLKNVVLWARWVCTVWAAPALGNTAVHHHLV